MSKAVEVDCGDFGAVVGLLYVPIFFIGGMQFSYLLSICIFYLVVPIAWIHSLGFCFYNILWGFLLG